MTFIEGHSTSTPAIQQVTTALWPCQNFTKLCSFEEAQDLGRKNAKHWQIFEWRTKTTLFVTIFPWGCTEFPAFSVSREIPEYSRFSRFVAMHPEGWRPDISLRWQTTSLAHRVVYILVCAPTFAATKSYRPSDDSGGARGCEQLAHSRYAAAPGRDSNPRPLDDKSDALAARRHHKAEHIILYVNIYAKHWQIFEWRTKTALFVKIFHWGCTEFPDNLSHSFIPYCLDHYV